MNKVIILSLSLLALVACNTTQKTNTKTDDNIGVGGEKDEHGCIVAAGQTWSRLNQNCIRLFEAGVRLNPIKVKEGSAIISAFIIYNDDKSKIELFLPDNAKASIVLNKEGIADLYQNENYKFDAKEQLLYINDEKRYAVEN
ncbi:hypothetical protein [Pseudopedobacter beijingensis]|uniref:Membrane-bound lysozyme-inhibitor of c-type lysozyme n=1 Tax=Pseudopedobacter beijingensis TaxID=1207056 RepID=A0ABW4IGI4_9SPHI